jgi:DNA-binding MarR family transcriptional regulator
MKPALSTPSARPVRRAVRIERVSGLDYDVLDELLGYAVRRAQLAMQDSFLEAARGLDTTPARFTALVVIGANPGLSQTVLGKVLGIARSGAMQLTDWLEARELVERRRAPNDARAWGVHLTPRGEKLTARLKQRVAEQETQWTDKLSSRERSELFRLLSKLTG